MTPAADTGRGGKWWKTALWLAAFTALYMPILLHYALSAPPNLDENMAIEAIRKPPTSIDNAYDYWDATDHPAMFALIDWAVLKATRTEIGDVPVVNKDESYEWNVEHGLLAPRKPVNVLRVANCFALMAALICIFLLTRFIFGGYVLGFLVTAPLGLAQSFGGALGGYIWTDSYLAFFLALSILVWVRLEYTAAPRSYRSVFIMGAVSGVLVSTKFNGGLVAIAYGTYQLLVSRSLKALLKPLAFAGTAFATFIILNPVFWRGGPFWWAHVIDDMFHHRASVIEMHRHMFGNPTFWQLFTFSLPFWYIAPLFAPILWLARRERWFPPVGLWTGVLVIGTIATINQLFARYLLPVNMSLTILLMFSTISLAKRIAMRKAMPPVGPVAD